LNWLREFTTYQGRLRRSQFLWRHFVLSFVGGAAAMLLMLALSVVAPQNTAFTAAMAIIMIPLMYADISLVVRRFHDVGLSGWWLTAIFAVTLLALALPLQGSSIWMFALLMPVNIGYVVLLLLVPGSKGANRYGEPSPRRD
jgi:uncharacterized membrane protein YhaH (DUF805 family)